MIAPSVLSSADRSSTDSRRAMLSAEQLAQVRSIREQAAMLQRMFSEQALAEACAKLQQQPPQQLDAASYHSFIHQQHQQQYVRNAPSAQMPLPATPGIVHPQSAIDALADFQQQPSHAMTKSSPGPSSHAAASGIETVAPVSIDSQPSFESVASQPSDPEMTRPPSFPSTISAPSGESPIAPQPPPQPSSSPRQLGGRSSPYARPPAKKIAPDEARETPPSPLLAPRTSQRTADHGTLTSGREMGRLVADHMRAGLLTETLASLLMKRAAELAPKDAADFLAVLWNHESVTREPLQPQPAVGLPVEAPAVVHHGACER